MDTRQLAAFCAVVERRSFSQAAERLGVTQPAVSLQVRALEKRLATQLLDRSGRRVEPTEAGLRLYRGAQRLLALEEQLVAEVAQEAGDELAGKLELGASTGPGGIVLSQLLCQFGVRHPDLHVTLWVFDTQTIVERVAARELELGIVGAARRHRGVVFEPFFRDPVVLVCPPGHRFAGKTIGIDALREEGLIAMQEGAGVRQLLEDELRKAAAHPLASARTLLKEAAKGWLASAGNEKYALHASNDVLTAVRLRDGQAALEFLRANPHWGGVSSCETAMGI